MPRRNELPGRPHDWMAHAACQGMELAIFFPGRGPNHAAEGKTACRSCPVRTECLEWALASGERGIWGGKGDQERRALLRHRRRKASTSDTTASSTRAANNGAR
jgi:WhiB family redox-sensing transcriptional regulator